MDWSRPFLGAGLILAWLLVLAGVPAHLSTLPASWLTFIGLLITPGYLLADTLTWRLELDWLERLGLAFPVGVAVLAVPGTVALLQHQTIAELEAAWLVVSGIVVLLWLIHSLWIRSLAAVFDNVWARKDARVQRPWKLDELVLLLLIVVVFAAIIPTLSLYKIDGDAYAVGAFTADALAGLPLNAKEPLFGTELGPGVRMIFNQSLPLTYLWAYLSSIDPITLTASASRAVIALWALLAAYTLGKAAGRSRRFGLFTAAVQFLIYLAAPFLRGDNVSLFFFERINADKFMVPVTMLPVAFAFAIRYARTSRRDAWIAAAVVTFAVSTIHPLIAAMLALGVGAFGGMHLLVSLRSRAAWKRSIGIWALVGIVMLLPLTQLVLARGEAPLASSYPSSFEGWSIVRKYVPALPFTYLPTLDVAGPLPSLATLDADAVYAPTNPFLLWRFAVNMDRRRLLLFDIDHYISDPSLIIEPPYLLALLLLPVLLWRLRSSAAAQFAVGTSLAILFVMFNPIVTPLIGSLVMPWILWRFVWVLPYALIIALAFYWPLTAGVSRISRLRSTVPYLPLALIVLGGVLLSPAIVRNVRMLHERAAAPYFFPTPERLLSRLDDVTRRTGPVTVMANQDLSVTIPAYVANANIVAHRAPTTSEVFPADQQDVALQRLIDQDTVYRTPYLTTEIIEILRRYEVGYIVTSTGSDLDLQLRLSPQWFEWVLDDQSFSLYAVRQIPPITAAIRGNTAMMARDWAAAERYYQQRPEDPLALIGLVEIARIQGQFDEALALLQRVAGQNEQAILQYRLGHLYAERGQVAQSIAALDRAQRAAPSASRFHVALGDICLRVGQEACAATQYRAAVANEPMPDEASRLIAQGDIWRQRGRTEEALPLYEQAVALTPSLYNQLALVQAYEELDRFEEALEVLNEVRQVHPLSTDVLSVMAGVRTDQGNFDEAIRLYRRAIQMRGTLAQTATDTRLALAQTLLEAGRLDEARTEIERLLWLHPENALAHQLQGDYYRRVHRFEEATAAYTRAFELDPTQIGVFVSLREVARQQTQTQETPLTALKMAIQANPDEPSLLLALGDQYRRLAAPEQAIDAYQAALYKLDPHTVTSRQAVAGASAQTRAFASARLADILEDLARIEPAMNYYRAAVAAAPDTPWARVLLGNALRRQNDPRAAEQQYREAIDGDPTYLNGYVQLADLLDAGGKSAEAEALLSQAPASHSRPVDGPLEPQRTSPTAALRDNWSEADSVETSVSPPTAPASEVLRQTSDAEADLGSVPMQARLYQEQGKVEQAITLYQQEIQATADGSVSPALRARYYRGLGDLYLIQGRLRDAAGAYEQAVALDQWWAEARVGLAQALLELGKVTDALTELETAVGMAPGSVEARLALANALDQHGKQQQALAMYRETAALYPGDARTTLALARAWHTRGRFDMAEARYREALNTTPGNVDTYVGLAELLIDRARYDEAAEVLQTAIALDRRHGSAYVRMGELERRRGNPEEALAWFKQASRLRSQVQSNNVTLVDALLDFGAYETALQYVQQALEQRPEDAELQLRLGRIQQLSGRYEEAEATLQRALALEAATGRVHAELARLYRTWGRPGEALSHFQQALKYRPGDTSYYLEASRLLTARGDTARAMELLEQGITRVSQPADLYAALAELHSQQGRPAEALALLEQAIAQSEDASRETPGLVLALGAYYASRAQLDAAAEQYNRARELRPDSPEPHIALAELYLRRGQADDALAQYQEAIAIAPTNAGYRLALGRAYELADRPEDTRGAYEEAIELSPILVEAYLRLAALHEAQEEWNAAQSVYERALAVAPTAGRLLTRYSTLLLSRGDREGALSLLAQVDRVSPTPDTLIARAERYGELGRPEDARRDLERAVEQAPASVEALVALGDWYRAQGNAERARELYLEATSVKPGVATGYLRLADLANEQGNVEEADTFAEQARAAAPGALELVDVDE